MFGEMFAEPGMHPIRLTLVERLSEMGALTE
jgi:hypothetical protein